MDGENKISIGDNLDILRDHVADASVDLIYLDPPFNSNANYNVLFKEKSGEESAAQLMALEDKRGSEFGSNCRLLSRIKRRTRSQQVLSVV
jgi:16S rRNA G966 N2-methylase RsmD